MRRVRVRPMSAAEEERRRKEMQAAASKGLRRKQATEEKVTPKRFVRSAVATSPSGPSASLSASSSSNSLPRTQRRAVTSSLTSVVRGPQLAAAVVEDPEAPSAAAEPAPSPHARRGNSRPAGQRRGGPAPTPSSHRSREHSANQPASLPAPDALVNIIDFETLEGRIVSFFARDPSDYLFTDPSMGIVNLVMHSFEAFSMLEDVMVGLSDDLKERLCVSDYSPRDLLADAADRPNCTICISQIEIGESVLTLPCRHRFHHECMTPWLADHKCCPLCKAEITAQALDEQYKSVAV